ncbi:hypothetical protein ACFFNY_22560 [Paenibacillus hodogayensis]|uniref:Sporulation protein n=1 Tax=Paenibacillus hodogayensis TaxID=279208 RepID=A0ABV5W1H7_9BACL
MKRLGRLLIPVVFIMLLISACGAKGGGTQQVKTYNNDGYLGITNTNPSMPMTPTYHTYEVDNAMMRDAVVPISGVRKVRITTHGANATVRLTVPKELAPEEKARIQTEALQALQQAVPRYDFKVTLKDG